MAVSLRTIHDYINMLDRKPAVAADVDWSAVLADVEQLLRQQRLQQQPEQQQPQPHNQLLYPVSAAPVPTVFSSPPPASPMSDDAMAAVVSLLGSLQRFQSSPVPVLEVSDLFPPASPNVTPGGDLYKTELCRAFEERGQCRYGDKCQFAHGMADLRSLDRHPKYKTELCRTFHSTGFCPYGARCHFVHNELVRSGGSSMTSPTGATNADQLLQLRYQLTAPRQPSLNTGSTSGQSPVRLADSNPALQLRPPPASVAPSCAGGSNHDAVPLQHRRRQNVVTLTLNSPSGTCPLWLSTAQCRLSSSSTVDSGLGGSTGSPASMSDVFSPSTSPVTPPGGVRAVPMIDSVRLSRPPPPLTASVYGRPSARLVTQQQQQQPLSCVAFNAANSSYFFFDVSELLP